MFWFFLYGVASAWFLCWFGFRLVCGYDKVLELPKYWLETQKLESNVPINQSKQDLQVESRLTIWLLQQTFVHYHWSLSFSHYYWSSSFGHYHWSMSFGYCHWSLSCGHCHWSLSCGHCHWSLSFGHYHWSLSCGHYHWSLSFGHNH